MRISLLVIGRPRHAGLAEAIRDYETRAARYWPLDVVEVKEESGRGLTPMLVMDREAERLVERIPADAQIVACDPGGEVMDSTRFAGWLQDQREQARSVALVIGGAMTVDTQDFTASGTWTKPANALWVEVTMCGAGTAGGRSSRAPCGLACG